jgi:hypothetical protein
MAHDCWNVGYRAHRQQRVCGTTAQALVERTAALTCTVSNMMALKKQHAALWHEVLLCPPRADLIRIVG